MFLVVLRRRPCDIPLKLIESQEAARGFAQGWLASRVNTVNDPTNGSFPSTGEQEQQEVWLYGFTERGELLRAEKMGECEASIEPND